MKTISLVAAILFFVLNTANAQDGGIVFEKPGDWQEVLVKAKKENKYIFLDCYATWCGPCKYMSKEVFSQPAAGKYFNSKFINVKVQMDRTKSDDEYVRKWYSDALQLEHEYSVTAYPTYLVFSPEGKALHRIVGAAETAGEFISKVEEAFDPAKQYYATVQKYQQHKNDSAYLRNAIQIALAASDRASAQAIANEYFGSVQNPFAKDNLQILQRTTLSSADKGYDLFLKHADQVNAVLGPGTAESVVAGIMSNEDIRPYFTDKNAPEPDWPSYISGLKQKYPVVPEKTIEQYQPLYYKVKRNIPEYEKAIRSYMNKYGEQMSAFELNDHAWDVFSLSGNREMLEEALKWSKKSVEMEKGINYDNYLDTYANLLYKLGRREEALKWEKIGLEAAKKDKDKKTADAIENTLARMEKGEKTWE